MAHPSSRPSRILAERKRSRLGGPTRKTEKLYGTRANSTQGQEQYYCLVAAPYSEPTQAYQQPPYTPPTHATGIDQAHSPAGSSSGDSGSIPSPTPPMATVRPTTNVGTISLEGDPSSHIPPYLVQANLTASNETPNSGAAPGGSNASISDTSTMGGPTSLNQQVGPIHSNESNKRRVPKPYRRSTPAPRKTRPITYEGDLTRLQQRCRTQGADEGAIELLGKVFTDDVSLKALTRPLTDAEIETDEFGVETGRVYITFLETINEEEGVGTYYVCRLCHSEQIWRHQENALWHLRRDHFGLADVCDQWYVSGRSLTLFILIINMLPDGLATKSSIPKGRCRGTLVSSLKAFRTVTTAVFLDPRRDQSYDA